MKIATTVRKSRILEFFGDLQYMDTGETFNEIRLKTQIEAGKYIARRWLRRFRSVRYDSISH